MATRYVTLTDDQEELIATLVQSGRNHDADEVLRDGLRLIEEREQRNTALLDELREAAQKGVSALERGEFTEFTDAEAMQTHLRAIADRTLARS